MARSENQKLKLLYLRDYLCRYSDPEHPVSIADMIEHLAKYGISAERKSLYSDIRMLQDYGMDIVMVKGQKSGYYLDSRDFELPELETAREILEYCWFTTLIAVNSGNGISYIMEGEGEWGEVIGFVIRNGELVYVGTDYFDFE